MSDSKLPSEELDLLRELVNVAMGLSASELASLFNYFVKLKVPVINIESVEELPETILKNSIFSEDEEIIAIRQLFNNNGIIKGEGIILLNKKTRESVLPLLGLSEEDADSEMISDFLMELSGQLMGSCLSNLLKQFYSSPTSYDPLEIIASDDSLRKFAYRAMETGDSYYEDILCSKIDFLIDKVNFQCDMFILFDPASLPNLRKALRKVLEESL
ncbi:hypothetical protein [Spirochaeta isovalerica]|uniref:Chemotaxis protein CheY-P-specific phosphatase CheC n=1 Tax=Spirochaeta isovalerica TaxID=150 RepID=A0A841RDU3_9SPIO|nr:hypothetical protein [Spirochaeta isovalerica]MBB6480542.1 chemotaxis protein CheY-P-specific phosphatase CheC [Spirochaeta isovalerica]